MATVVGIRVQAGWGHTLGEGVFPSPQVTLEQLLAPPTVRKGSVLGLPMVLTQDRVLTCVVV